MDSESDDDRGGMTYGQIEQYFNDMALEGPSAQERIDRIFPFIVSLLPPPLVPAPEADGGSDSDDERFSLTSSSSAASDAGEDPPPFPPEAPGDGEDHISRLPDSLLSDIISRIPTKEAARTIALSTRWRGVWAATPLVVDEAHLVGDEGLRDIPILRAASRCVDAHPGPVRAVRLTRVSFYHHEYALKSLVAALADKEVQDLILFNRPWPLNMPLPDDVLFRCASLERLYLGVWHLPKITAARPPALDNLRELGISHCIIENEDLEALLAHCPKLEVLSLVMGYHSPSRLRIVSRSIKVVVEWMSDLDEVVIEDAPCLKRLVFKAMYERRPLKIVLAPRLEVLGFLDLDLHSLEIGGIAIKAGMEVRASSIVPSLKILAVKVQFARNRDAKMLHTLLKCFPCLETLHIMPVASKSPDTADLDFWESLGSCQCLESHLKTVVFHAPLTQNYDIGFSRYISREGKVLRTMIIPWSEELEENWNSAFLGESDVSVRGGKSVFHPGLGITPWSFQNGTNLALDDPFCVLRTKA